MRYGIHDISNTGLDPDTGLPRFNMPFELGLFLGARTYGKGPIRQKRAMILDRQQHRYQAFLSDIAGQDIHAHNGEVATLIRKVCAWLRDEAGDDRVPGGTSIAREFARFHSALPTIAATRKLEVDELTFKDFVAIARAWIVEEAG